MRVRILRSFQRLLQQAGRCSVHTAACVICALVLLVMAAAPHVHLFVCTGTGECCAVVAEHPACCGGCCGERDAVTPPPERRPGEERVRSECGPHCCVDLLVDVDPAPVPTAAGRIAPPVAACEPPAMPRTPHARTWPEHTAQPATGPPRVDRKAALVASTVLRL